LSDTGFGRAVEEFSADSTGPIVEAPAELVAETPADEAPAPEQPLEPPSLDDLGIELLPADEPIDVEEVVVEPQQAETIEPVEEVAEPIEESEQPTPLLGGAQDSLVVDDSEVGDEAVERLFDLTPTAPAPAAEDEVELESLEPVAPAAQDVEPVEAVEEMPVQEPLTEEPLTEEPQAVELEEYGLDMLSDEPAVEPEPLADIDIAPLASAAPIEEASDQFTGMDLEPIEVVEEPASTPAAPEPVAKAPLTPAPPQEPPAPAAPPVREAAPPERQVAEEFNWGANQDQFLGGMPLKLTAPPRPAPQPQQPAPVADAKQPPQPKPTPRIGANIAPDTFAGGGKRTIPPPKLDIPPLTKDSKSATSVTTGFDGLAMPSGKQTDVFSQQPASLSGGFGAATNDDVFGRRATPAPRQEPAIPPTEPSATPQQRPRRATKAEATGDVWAANPLATPEIPRPRREVAVAPPVEEVVQPEPTPRKRRWFGWKAVFFVLLLGCAGAFYGVYQFMPLKSVVTGSMKFNNFTSLPRIKRVELQNQQRDLLADEKLRTDAQAKLIALKRGAAGGFLDDPANYSRTVSAASLDLEKGVLTIPYVGAGTDEDKVRVLALMQAVHSANRTRVETAEGLLRTVTSLTQEQAATAKRIDERDREIEQLKAVAENAPDSTERTKFEADAARLESAYNAAVANVARLSTELKQLRDGASAAPAAPLPPPPDAQLSQLQGDLQKLNDRVGVIQEGRSEKAATARRQLDVALESFNKQIEQAQGVVKNNPELLAYITNAQKTIEQTRELTDQLIRRQQEQYSQLSEVKQKLNEKMLARRAEVWKKDPELLKLMDEKEIKTRQYNAATAQNMTKEAGDLKAELDYLTAAIRARQTIVADDGFYADAIDQLQKIIDSTQRGLEDDRKHTMQVLDEMQSAFAKNQPALANLTPEQKQIAAEMDKRLADVSAARKQYTEAADAANKQADDEIRGLQLSAADLASRVAARKKQLADAGAAEPVAPLAPSPEQQAKLLEQKSAELAAAEKGRVDAEAAFFAANKKLVEIRNRIEQSRAAGEKKDSLMRQNDIDRKLNEQLTNQLDLKKKEAEVAVYPTPPTPADIKLDPKPDLRPMYALGGCAGVMFLCVALFLISGIGAGGERAAITPPPPGYGRDDEDGNGEVQPAPRGKRAARTQV
jgi:hypothetical protein